MIRSQFILLMSILSILVAYGGCQIDRTIDIWNRAGFVDSHMTINLKTEEVSEEKVVSQLVEIIDKIEETAFEGNDNVNKSTEELFDEIKKRLPHVQPRLSTLVESAKLIDFYYDIFYKTVAAAKNTEKNGKHEIFDYLKDLIEDIVIFEKMIFDMRKTVKGEGDESDNLFTIMGSLISSDSIRENGSKMITRGHLFSFYRTLVGMEYKGNMMLIIALKFSTIFKTGNYASRIGTVIESTKIQILNYANEAYDGMKYASPETRLAHDIHNIKSETYVELDGFSRGFILRNKAFAENDKRCEVDHPLGDTCSYRNRSCSYSVCTKIGGKLKKCRNLNADSLDFCPTADFQLSWIQTDDGRYYGNHSDGAHCQYTSWSESIDHEQSKTSPTDGFCFCNCERRRWKTGDVRAFSLMWSEADYRSNRVITNIKFEVRNGLIHLRAQHGRILVGGLIDQSSLAWSRLPDVTLVEMHEELPYYIQKYGDQEPDWQETEYSILISDDLKFNLDDVYVPEGHVIIGVALTIDDPAESNAIELTISSMEYDYSTGELNQGHKSIYTASQYLKDNYGSNKRKEIDLGAPNNPFNGGTQEKIFESKPYRTVKFQQTDFQKDLGQSTVPFLDIRSLNPTPASPLAAVGFYYRGRRGHGGFIAPKIVSFNLLNIFRSDMDSVNDN